MYKNFNDILAKVQAKGPYKVAVAAAEDLDVLKSVKEASDLGLIYPILTGDTAAIKSLCAEVGLEKFELAQAAPQEAAIAAVSLVSSGEAHALMKGLINTSDFLRAVLDPEKGLRTSRRLSHLMALELPGTNRLAYLTDGAINPSPDLEAKTEILESALEVLGRLGYQKPKVALLAANEQVNPKIPATSDAWELSQRYQAMGAEAPAIVEGPLALDVAVSPEAAHHKGIKSNVSGEVDLFLAPNIESGNIFIKAAFCWGNAPMAGMVIGAKAPIILTSRSDTPTGKLNSIALAVLASS